MTDSPYNRFQSLKILAYAERSLLPIVRGEMPYPLDWHIYPSNICQHHCNFCMFVQNGEQEHFAVKLPRDLLLRAVRDAARTGAVLVHFSGGGEPLLNRHTPEAMALAHELGLKVALSTNGAALTPEVAGLVDYIRVSLNAGTPEQHWRTNHDGDPRHPGDWQRIMGNIARCVMAKRQDIGLGFVVDHQNYRDILAFCRIAAQLNVDFVHIRPGFYYDTSDDAAVRAVMPDAARLCAMAKWELRETPLRIFSITEKFDGYWTPRTYHRCRAVLTGVCLRATGDFAVCQDRIDLTFGHEPSYQAGAAFEDVWLSDEHKAVVARIHDGAGGELSACPRCVWGKRNEIIDALETDDLRIALV